MNIDSPKLALLRQALQEEKTVFIGPDMWYNVRRDSRDALISYRRALTEIVENAGDDTIKITPETFKYICHFKDPQRFINKKDQGLRTPVNDATYAFIEASLWHTVGDTAVPKAFVSIYDNLKHPFCKTNDKFMKGCLETVFSSQSVPNSALIDVESHLAQFTEPFEQNGLLKSVVYSASK